MYNNIIPAGGAGILAYTGINSLWYCLAAFALIATGIAIMRIIPRKEGTSPWAGSGSLVVRQ